MANADDALRQAAALALRIDNDFTYYKPTEGQPEKYEEIRATAKAYALRLVELCPPSRELSVALTKLDEVVFWANAAIARA